MAKKERSPISLLFHPCSSSEKLPSVILCDLTVRNLRANIQEIRAEIKRLRKADKNTDLRTQFAKQQRSRLAFMELQLQQRINVLTEKSRGSSGFSDTDTVHETGSPKR